MAKQETYPQARKRLFTYLESQGWTVNRALKVPQAVRNGAQLFFHSQAVYLHQHSLLIDIRGMTGVSFDREVVQALHLRGRHA
jgi:hypothetical protein